jgi:hypothetical protein
MSHHHWHGGMRVKPNSIWFEEAAQLARWQAARKRGNAKAFAAYQAKVLRQREAWQFIYELPVKILRYEPKAGAATWYVEIRS